MSYLTSPESLLGLFLLSFLAATLLPLGSEWLLAGMILAKQPVTTCILIATLGNTLGACTSYALGVWGADWMVRRVLRVTPERQKRAERICRRYGGWVLLFSWTPLIGDPLCLAGGALKIPFGRFLFPVFTGKLGRYLAVALLAGMYN
jgi:membrane protein YqaA with SNARE-associated domain